MIVFAFSWLLLLQVLVSTLLPLLVALISTTMTSGSRKAVLLLALSALTSLLAQLADALTSGRPFDLFTALVMALVGFFVAVATHFGIWKAENSSGGSVAATLTAKGRHAADISR